MKTCKTCKWWLSPEAGSCFGECKHPKTRYDFSGGVERTDGAQAIGLSEDGAIETGPDFGCVHHETSVAYLNAIPLYTLEAKGNG